MNATDLLEQGAQGRGDPVAVDPARVLVAFPFIARQVLDHLDPRVDAGRDLDRALHRGGIEERKLRELSVETEVRRARAIAKHEAMRGEVASSNA